VLRAIVLLLLLFLPFAPASSAERIYRLGSLSPTAESLEVTRRTTLPELAKLGFREGENLVIDESSGDAAKLPELAREMVNRHPDAIIAIGGEAIRAAHQATTKIPIVMFGADPIRSGYAEGLAHPGGNVTGVVILAVELDGKRVDLLHEAVPNMRRLAGLFVPSAPARQTSENEMRGVAMKLGLEFLPFEASGPEQYPAAFTAMRAAGAQGVAFMANPYLYRDGAQLAELAINARLPAVCEWAEMARAGCLVGYGPNRAELRKRLAYHLTQIFRGEPAGEIPTEQPSRYELAINLETAKTLGIEVPQSFVARADEVIE